ncbi:MAG: hypothetical protein ACYDDE_00675 [bacterium]
MLKKEVYDFCSKNHIARGDIELLNFSNTVKSSRIYRIKILKNGLRDPNTIMLMDWTIKGLYERLSVLVSCGLDDKSKKYLEYGWKNKL